MYDNRVNFKVFNTVFRMLNFNLQNTFVELRRKNLGKYCLVKAIFLYFYFTKHLFSKVTFAQGARQSIR